MANEVRLIDGNKAEAVLRNIADHLKEAGNTDLYPATYAAADVIKQQRTVDPESLRPNGRWVDPKWNDMWQSMIATCSHCLERGEVRVRTNEHGMKVINSPSCPNCGADMRGENDGSS